MVFSLSEKVLYLFYEDTHLLFIFGGRHTHTHTDIQTHIHTIRNELTYCSFRTARKFFRVNFFSKVKSK